MIEENVMVTLPPDFVSIKFPGYFWNLRTKRLYSIKSGLLKPLKKIKKKDGQYILQKVLENWFDGLPLYCVSIKGQKRYISDKYLEKLRHIESEIPMI